MIVDDATRLVSKAHDVRSLREAQRHSQAVSTRRQNMERLVARLERTRAIRDALEAEGTELASSPQAVDTIAKLRAFRGALDDDLGSALQSDVFAKAQEAAERAVKGHEEHASTVWRRYATQHLPTAPEEILGALAAEPQSRLTVLQIRRLTETVRRLVERPLPTADEIQEFETHVSQLRDAWSQLDVEGLDPAIVEFLRATASERGAGLDLLTSDVLRWLQDRGADSNYVIRPAD